MDDNFHELDQNRVTADLRAFMTANMTAGDIQALAFDIGIDPTELDGALADELAQSLIHVMAQRSELQLLDTALRDTLPADYRLAFGDTLRDDATAGWSDETQ
jgi:hypothetical protein